MTDHFAIIELGRFVALMKESTVVGGDITRDRVMMLLSRELKQTHGALQALNGIITRLMLTLVFPNEWSEERIKTDRAETMSEMRGIYDALKNRDLVYIAPANITTITEIMEAIEQTTLTGAELCTKENVRWVLERVLLSDIKDNKKSIRSRK